MRTSTRKEFLRTSALLLGSITIGTSFDFRKKPLLLSFSTLGCPDWTFEQITDFASSHGYQGIEVRGLLRQMDLTQCPEFITADHRKETMNRMKKKGLHFVGLGSSANMHAEGAEREKNLEEAKRFIDLAAQVHCPYVRVFPNNLPKEQDKKEVLSRISKGLAELGAYASNKKVMVLMETHGDVTATADILLVMHAVDHPNVGLVWDVCNMWTVTKESPAMVYERLKKYIRHTHIKDAKLVDGKPQYTLLGQGDVPIFQAIDALANGGYKGYYSFEWEKLWHPEIAAPEVAIADYPVAMKRHFEGGK
jgi:sugar phosphate isomerase/epimerase